MQESELSWAMLIILLLSTLYAGEIYGPMPALTELAPTPNTNHDSSLDLKYNSWYQRLGQKAIYEREIDWSIKPHRDFTDQLKNQAIEGGLNVNETIKKFNPTQVETELIIRY